MTHPASQYFPANSEGYTNDYRLFFAKTLKELPNPGTHTVEWDFISPVTEHNKVAGRNSFVSMKLEYTSTGAQAVDFNAGYTLKITVFDKARPAGKVVRTITQRTHLDAFQAYAAFAPLDPGNWTLRETVNGNETSQMFTVANPPESPAGVLSRRVGDVYTQLTSAAYTTDQWVMMTKTYPLSCEDVPPEEDDPPECTRRSQILWHWRGPEGENKTSLGTYRSVKLKYRTNAQGSIHRLTYHVYDRNNPGGRLVTGVNGTGTLANTTITDGSGLVTYGNWSFEESVNNVTATNQTFEARKIVAQLGRTPASFAAGSGDAVAYPITFQTFPATWIPGAVTFRIRLADAEHGTLLRVLSDTVTGNTANPLEHTIHWDGTVDTGPLVLGTAVSAQLEVDVPEVSSAASRHLAHGGPVADAGGDLAANVGPPPAGLRMPPDYPTWGVSPRMGAKHWVNTPGPRSGQIDMSSGETRQVCLDMGLQTRGLPIVIGRYYVSERRNNQNGGWVWTFQRELLCQGGVPPFRVTHMRPDGTQDPYERSPQGAYVPTRADITDKLAVDPSNPLLFTITNKDRQKYTFQRLTGQTDRAVLVKEEDRNGNANTYQWDSVATGQRLNSITDPAGRQVTLGFSGTSPQTVRDWTGRTITYGYNVARQNLLLARVSLPDGQVTDYDYTAHNVPGTNGGSSLLSAVALPGRFGLQEKMAAGTYETQRQFRNARGMLTTWTRTVLTGTGGGTPVFHPDDRQLAQSGDGPALDVGDQVAGAVSATTGFDNLLVYRNEEGQLRTWRGEFDSSYMPRKTIDPDGGVTEYSYNRNDTLEFYKNARDQVTSFRYDEIQNPILVTDAAGGATNITWTPTNEVETISKQVSGQLLTTTMTYDANGNLKQAVDPAGHISRYDYNQFGQLAKITNQQGKEWTFAYNGSGYLVSKSTPGDNGGTVSWIFTPDALGRNLEIQDPKGGLTTYTYDSRDRVTSITLPPAANGARRTVRYTWNKQDLMETLNDGAGHTYRYEYDNTLRLERLIEVSNGNRATSYTYTANGDLRSIRHPGNQEVVYTYDDLHRVKTATYPGGLLERYEWDKVGNLQTWHKADGTAVSYGYDSLNRLTSISHPATQTNIGLSYDELSRPKTMSDPAGSSSYSYTANGLTDTVTRDGKTIDFDYDILDRLTTVKDPEGIQTTYTYTDRDLLASASQEGKTVNYTYDLNENMSSMHYPNGISCALSYSPRDEVTQMDYKKGGSPLVTLNYAYNADGTLRKADRVGAGLGRDDDRTYEYDKRSEVTESTKKVKVGNTTSITAKTYTYDDNYNRRSYSVNGTSGAETTDPADKLNSGGGASFSYNANGNVNGITYPGGHLSFTYNHADQPVNITGPGGSAFYTYDGGGKRVKRKTPDGMEVTYLWAGEEVVKEYHQEGNVQYLMGAGREAIKKDGSWRFYLTDLQGSTLALTDDQGNVTDTWEYGDFGETNHLTGNSYNPYLYTGQQLDPEFGGHYYLRARLYFPQYGRFLVRDPLGWRAGTNVYAYCQNSPLNSSDPSGLQDIPFGPASVEKATEYLMTDANVRYRNLLRAAFSRANLVRLGFSMAEAGSLVSAGIPVKFASTGLRFGLGAAEIIDVMGAFRKADLSLSHHAFEHIADRKKSDVTDEIIQLAKGRGRGVEKLVDPKTGNLVYWSERMETGVVIAKDNSKRVVSILEERVARWRRWRP